MSITHGFLILKFLGTVTRVQINKSVETNKVVKFKKGTNLTTEMRILIKGRRLIFTLVMLLLNSAITFAEETSEPS